MTYREAIVIVAFQNRNHISNLNNTREVDNLTKGRESVKYKQKIGMPTKRRRKLRLRKQPHKRANNISLCFLGTVYRDGTR